MDTSSGVVTKGAVAPGAADEGAQYNLIKNILATINLSLMKFAD